MNQISVFVKSGADGVIRTTILTQFKVFTHKDIDNILQLKAMPSEALFEMKVVSSRLPFRVNQYVIENLIDWSKIPEDTLYQLTFPQTDMLPPELYQPVARLIEQGAPRDQIQTLATTLRAQLNPQAGVEIRSQGPVLAHTKRLP